MVQAEITPLQALPLATGDAASLFELWTIAVSSWLASWPISWC
jgi:hypothetical protein